MAKRPRLVWLVWLVLAAFAGCSFDSRTLKVTDGPGGSDASGGTTSGASTSGGDASLAGKVGSSGSVGMAGSVSGEGGGGGAPGLAAGEACKADGDCASGPCLDGVCCAAACAGPCQSCSSALTGKADGACESVQAGMDPHDDCAQGKDVCGLDGQCDGAGACRFAPPSTMCGMESCANDQYTPPAQCDGAGACSAPAAVSCSGHPCVGTRCAIPCTTTPDCPKGLYCDNKVCAPQKTNGVTCATADECASAVCNGEKVCCDKACDTTCNSCKQASTGQTDGKCAFVQAGVKHGTDCPGAAKCNAAGSGVTPAPTCNGAGACAPAGDTLCTPYACNAANASCKTQCAVATDCAKADYCSANACKAKLANGAVCSATAQCVSGVCGGRCCASDPCVCPQPSSGNLIKNPGFDKDLASWNVETGAATINWQPGTFMDGAGSYADANACAYSGAAYISEPDSNDSQKMWQCVPIALNTDYNFSAQMATLGGADAHCMLDLYQGPGCTGNVSNVGDAGWLNVAWSPGTYPSMFNSTFFVSAKVYCYVHAGGSFFIDDVYLTPTPNMY